MLEWKSFSVNDLFKDFNEVIDKAYNNTYNVSLKNYERNLNSFERLVNELPDDLNEKNGFIDILLKGQGVLKSYDDEEDKFKKSLKKLKKENNKKLKVNKYCLNELITDRTFNDSKSNLKRYFSSGALAVTPVPGA